MPGGVVWPPPGKDFEHALIWCTLRAKSQYLAPNFEDLSRDGCLKHFNTGCDQAVWECGRPEIRKRLTHIYFIALFSFTFLIKYNILCSSIFQPIQSFFFHITFIDVLSFLQNTPKQTPAPPQQGHKIQPVLTSITFFIA